MVVIDFKYVVVSKSQVYVTAYVSAADDSCKAVTASNAVDDGMCRSIYR